MDDDHWARPARVYRYQGKLIRKDKDVRSSAFFLLRCISSIPKVSVPDFRLFRQRWSRTRVALQPGVPFSVSGQDGQRP
jgi:hypothetical protein